MKKLLNTLYVTTQGTYISRDGETVLVKKDDEILLRVPIHTLHGIVCFGRVSMSGPLMGFCGERQVQVSFLSEPGEFQARVQGPVAGNVLLRREQYRAADDPVRATLATFAIVAAKIANCRTVLLRSMRDNPHTRSAVEAPAATLGKSLESLDARRKVGGLTVDTLRGVEGDCARAYFGAFDHLILANKDEFTFRGRSRRPALDRVNALLSFAYTLLVHDVTAALESVGLDPCVGFLHVDRPGRPGLALDLMEELRPILADRLVLSLINRQQVTAKNFTMYENGAVLMDDAGRREVLQSWQKRKKEEVLHPFLEETIELGLFPHVQALLLARWLRGDLDGYAALIWR
jgi:CRISPR-associated protein Cas1